MKMNLIQFFRFPNAIYTRSCEWNQRPSIMNASSVCPALDLLQDNVAVIQAECNAAYDDVANSPRYHELDRDQSGISDSRDGKSWRVFYLEAMGKKFEKNRKKFPRTSQLLDQVPHVFQAFFSRLDPRKEIPIHHTLYNGYLRYHLAVKVPQKDPPYMLLGGSELRWVEGKGVLFDDSIPHEVINRCDESRIVLIVDIMRPMSLMGRATYHFMQILLRRTYVKRIEKGFEGSLMA